VGWTLLRTFLTAFLLSYGACAQESLELKSLKGLMAELGFLERGKEAEYSVSDLATDFRNMVHSPDSSNYWKTRTSEDAAALLFELDSRHKRSLVSLFSIFHALSPLDRRLNFIDTSETRELLSRVLVPMYPRNYDYPQIIDAAVMAEIASRSPAILSPSQKRAMWRLLDLKNIQLNGEHLIEMDNPFIDKQLAPEHVRLLDSYALKRSLFVERLMSPEIQMAIAESNLPGIGKWMERFPQMAPRWLRAIALLPPKRELRLELNDANASSLTMEEGNHLLKGIYENEDVANWADYFYHSANFILSPHCLWVPEDLQSIYQALRRLSPAFKKGLPPLVITNAPPDAMTSGWYAPGLKTACFGDDRQLDTILHELAHALDFNQQPPFSHSRRWLAAGQWKEFRYQGTNKSIFLSLSPTAVSPYAFRSPMEDFAESLSKPDALSFRRRLELVRNELVPGDRFTRCLATLLGQLPIRH
jgi:hypothetical protein